MNPRGKVIAFETFAQTFVALAASITRVGCVAALGMVVFTSAALGQEQFSAGDGSNTYTDQFQSNCHQGQQPNIFAQLGMNPMACRGQVAPQDSNGRCTLQGMTLLKQIGNTCYYCSPIVPPIKGILIPFDQVGNAQHQGYACGVDQLDPNCTAICTRADSSTKYTPPPPPSTQIPINPSYGTPAGANGPCEDYTGLDMSTPAGQAAAYQRCSDFLCQHNPDLTRCQAKTIVSTQQSFEPVPVKLTGGVVKYHLVGKKSVTITLKVNGKPTPVPLLFDVVIGGEFPRNKDGYVTSGTYNVNTGETTPDPTIKQFWGDLDSADSQFRVKTIEFSPAAVKLYGQASYTFPTNARPILQVTGVTDP